MVPFLSVVLVVRNQREKLRGFLVDWTDAACRLGQMCEVIVVDNASTDGSALKLKELAAELPDLQVYLLSKRVNKHTALRAGLENALGDQILVIGVDMSVKQKLSRDELNLILQFPPRPLLVRFAEWLSSLLGCGVPRYHIAQEFGSTVKTRRQRLNVEQAT